ncbi:MAG: hypothetical protein H6Q70_66 [Firmicutes bacterium]|nr:hypothetical protein [Bacillota bacterium]
MSEDKPRLVIFAGPNGSGKSSLIRIATGQDALPNLYINADDMAKEIVVKQGLDTEDLTAQINLQAAQKADLLREEALNKKISFATETVMSTPAKITLMQEARDKGYEVHLRYITTQDSTININRVHDRVQKGGHDVPHEKTQARYEKAMKLLPLAVHVADVAKVYNNSFENPKLILEKAVDREIKIYPQNPPNLESKWTLEKLEQLKAEILKLDRCEEILQGVSISDLSKKADSKALFTAYAKEVLNQNGRIWKEDTNKLIVEKLLKAGVSLERVKCIMRHSLEPLKDIRKFVRGIEKSLNIKVVTKSRGIER